MITHLERREPARNRLRFYNIAVARTLFDGWAVVREWGRTAGHGAGDVVRYRKRHATGQTATNRYGHQRQPQRQC